MNESRNEELVRRSKLTSLRKEGFDYPNGFAKSDRPFDLFAKYGELTKEQLEEQDLEVIVAGRIMLRRVMGKASFITIQDGTDIEQPLKQTNRIQCYVRKDDVGADAYDEFDSLFDTGDIVGISGTLMKTNRGELTVHARRITFLTKSLHALPDKFHGLTDQEFKYRHRHVDLIVNPDSMEVFRVRSVIVSEIRRYFEEQKYMEVETPMMQVIPGGALARPFVTHHNALDLDLYLRVAPELYLKRLIVGGFDRVFEINRNFRNEGLSTKHNPEFTSLEFYVAYQTYENLMDLTEGLLQRLVMAVQGVDSLESLDPLTFQSNQIDFSLPARRLSMREAVMQEYGLSQDEVQSKTKLTELALADSLMVKNEWSNGDLLNQLFEHRVEKQLIQPTFITNHPIEISPLARKNSDDSTVADRFELFVGGYEIANAFSELNDPDEQRNRFEKQALLRESGDSEAMRFDAEFIHALEYGMPPTAGEGIGIDRLVMLLTNSASIKDVLLFPHLRPIPS